MSNIRKSKNHQDVPDFDKMWGEVQEEIQEKDAEDAVVNRAPELKKLSEDIDKATNTWIIATLQLESAIQQYQRCERKLDSTVTDIRGKVDTINEHIDNVLKDAPTKLQVSVNVAEILLLILDGTEILGNEVDVFLNLLDSTTELFVLVFTEEGASCTEVVELSYCI